jgi:tetratricopeptide (TPR) repeat protein
VVRSLQGTPSTSLCGCETRRLTRSAQQIAPRYTQLAAQHPQAIFLRVDVDAQKAIAAKYRISAMPTFLAFKAGAQVAGALVRGADPNALGALVARHAGPNPPVAPLPAEAEAAKAAGNAAFAEGAYERAVEEYTRALEAAPESVQLLGNRSFAYLKRYAQTGDAAVRTMARQDAEKATALDPRYQKGWVRLAETLVSESEDEGAADVRDLLRQAESALLKAVETGEGKAKTGLSMRFNWLKIVLTPNAEAEVKLNAVRSRL